MIFFYIDESGTGLKDPRSPYFILAALSVPISAWQQLDDDIADLKHRIVSYAKPEDWEIKGRDLRRGEKLFRALKWPERIQAMTAVANTLASLPVHILAAHIDTRDLPEFVATDADLFRLAFWRLLDEIEHELTRAQQPGMIFVDARSDLHSSVQDRRLIDAYRDWLATRNGRSRLVETPWFGFSAFYAGLQLADFCAYLIDSVANEERLSLPSRHPELVRRQDMHTVYEIIRRKVRIVHIP